MMAEYFCSAIKKLFVAKTKLVNNLIRLKDGCLRLHSHFRLLLRGDIKGVECRLSPASFTEETPVFGFRSQLCMVTVNCMYSVCLLRFVSELSVRLLS